MSEPPYDSLNLGRSVGDAADRVEENRRRFLGAVGATGRLFEVSQVHGGVARIVTSTEEPEVVRSVEADALVARERGLAVAVRVADCVPVMLADPETGAVAAVHAGWRGCVAGILVAALDLLGARAAAGGRLLAAIGPHIRVDAFEVGQDVAARLEAAAEGAEVVRPGPHRPHADLSAVVVAQLRRAGLDPARIEDVGGCTFAEPERFFSFRRDGARSGRHLALIEALG